MHRGTVGARGGVPATPTFADLTTDPLWFRIALQATLPQRVYDYQAHTLDLGALMRSFPAWVYSTVDPALSELWYAGHLAGAASFDFTGR